LSINYSNGELCNDFPRPEAMVDMFYILAHFEDHVKIEIDSNDIRKVIELGQKTKESLRSAITIAILLFCEALMLRSICMSFSWMV